jgi:hypothetical protein
MNKVELKISDVLAEDLKPKLLNPFKKGNNLLKVVAIIDKRLDELVVGVRDEYKNHIEKPSTSFANRFRFLFTGELK